MTPIPVKHTAGPWFAVPSRRGFTLGNGTNILTADGLVVARMSVKADKPYSQKVADAHLIAAAPDLLDALLAVISVADRQTVEFDKARAAIRKARGQSQGGAG